MKIEYFIKRDFITASPFAGVADLKQQLFQRYAIVIKEEDKYFGVLTPFDIIKRPHTLAVDCLTAKTEISIHHEINVVIQLMKIEITEVLPVFDKKKLVGLIFKNDILEYLKKHNIELQNEIEIKTKKLQDQNNEFREKILNQKAELENIIEQRTKELIGLVETKDKFINIIAHELRNPFISILGFLSLLQENIRNYDIDKIEKYLVQIHSSTSITFELLESLLKWLNAKNRKVPFSPFKQCIYSLLTCEITNTSFVAEQKQISIKNNVSENTYAYVDEDMIKTVFRNLICNAIKFTEPNGEITISSKETNQFIEITVKDTGVGIPPEISEKLFNIEGVKSIPGTLNETGSGLGLLLCKEFIEISGGKIGVESILNQGTEFKFTLPKFNEKQ